MARILSRWFTPALIAFGLTLVSVNWYLAPARAKSWVAAAVVLAIFAVAWAGTTIVLGRSTADRGPLRAAISVRGALVFATLMMVFSLATKLGVALGALDGAEVSRRASMVLMGLLLAFLGNSMPKTLTPLPALSCDPARVQALQRLSGWTWVLAGIAYAIAWLALPVALASPVSILVVVAAMLVVVIQLIRLLGTRARAV
jgi:hypothetical protein